MMRKINMIEPQDPPFLQTAVMRSALLFQNNINQLKQIKMKTLINELIIYLKIRNEGIAKVLGQSNLTNFETDRYNGMYDMNLSIIQELETDYLHKEKERIMTAFDFGRNIYGEKTADDFFNKMYPQSCSEADA